MPIKSSSSISSFLGQINKHGGVSTSNNFIVEVDYFAQSVDGAFANKKDMNTALLFLCDEAQLPNINTATGTQNGVLTGIGSVDYPHTKIFTEIQLTFMLDANLSLLKFFNEWYSRIFKDGGASIHASEDTLSPLNRATRLQYRNKYASRIKITKTEPGKLDAAERKPITYVLENAWPYSIDAVPLQFGSSQITKLTVNFKYERHQIIQRDIRSIKGMQKGEIAEVLRDDGPGIDPPLGMKKGQINEYLLDEGAGTGAKRKTALDRAVDFTGLQDLNFANRNIG